MSNTKDWTDSETGQEYKLTCTEDWSILLDGVEQNVLRCLDVGESVQLSEVLSEERVK